jgi:hypothetical protein
MRTTEQGAVHSSLLAACRCAVHGRGRRRGRPLPRLPPHLIPIHSWIHFIISPFQFLSFRAQPAGTTHTSQCSTRYGQTGQGFNRYTAVPVYIS